MGKGPIRRKNYFLSFIYYVNARCALYAMTQTVLK